MRYNKVERQGVNAVEKLVINDFDWIFRDQPSVDVGVDALVEQVLDGNPTGQILALQIKSAEEIFTAQGQKSPTMFLTSTTNTGRTIRFPFF